MLATVISLAHHDNIFTLILIVFALDETNLSNSLHFSMQNIEKSCDLNHPSWQSNVSVSL